MEESVTYLVKD